ncbi:PHP domain-containing protein [Ornithinimicrobium sp. INDO-MA30-4]|uniref:PHP domain-containing protein n=1 Tax=Ornithinimicrobium sp. INDO-MA30-4 TaxID=2908651 RepID=UPI002882D584|nr:PHP domain-containing protein [Ornithinimicrobium sp. INDO-MA30-4]
MEQGFPHLHVASSFSLRHGASTPAELVRRAADLGQSTLALTDRDGTYGAVRFVQACQEVGISPVLGVDLVYAHSEQPPGHPGGKRPRAQPAKGGVVMDDRRPRVTVLARGQQAGLAPGQGWARTCRMVTKPTCAVSEVSPVCPLMGFVGPQLQSTTPARLSSCSGQIQTLAEQC